MCYENSLGVLGMVAKIEESLEFGTGIAGGVETRSAWSARGEKQMVYCMNGSVTGSWIWKRCDLQ